MKKLLAVIVAALMLGSFAVTAPAADLANYAKDATATEWTAGETRRHNRNRIRPRRY